MTQLGVHMKPEISVLIPIYNERENLEPLIEELEQVLVQMEVSYEVIIVDDGSRDGSFEIIEKITQEHPHVIGIRLRKNFGQTAALVAAIDHAQGELLIPMDGDLQNDPNDIPKMVQVARKGNDIVSGWRKNRQDRFLRSWVSKVANKLIGWFFNLKLNDFGCSLKVYRAEALKNLQIYRGMHRFLPAVASWEGATVVEMEVNHRKRQSGKSKYTLKRTRGVLIDLIALKFFTSYINKPMRVFGRVAIWMATFGSIAFMKLVYDKVFYGQDITNSGYLFLGIFFFIIAIQILGIGLLCELEMRNYYESLGKKIYRVEKISSSER